MGSFSLLPFLHCQEVNKQENRRPNILICIADDQSYPHTSFYGTTWISTPNFDRVAREGISFRNAYTPNAKCAPSRSALLTGRNPWQLEEAANHSPYFPSKFRTYAEVLAAHGYQTGFTGKGWAPGNPGSLDGKRRELLGPAFNRHQLAPPTPGISPIDYAANFREFMEDKESGQPFCFWVGGLEPHRPYTFGTGSELAGKHIKEIDTVYPFWPDADSVRQDLLDYAYEIEYFDKQLGKILTILEEAGELDNTLVIVTADNGMPFPRVKGYAYEDANHLPLAMMWKDGIHQPGRSYEPFVSFTDLAPTILELAGITPDASGMAEFEGHSLFPVFAGKKDPYHRAFMVIGKERNDVGRPRDQGYPIRGIIQDGFLYLRNFEPDRWPAGNPETGYLDTDGSPTKTMILNQRRQIGSSTFWDINFGKRPGEELYDLRQDRHCVHNLATDPAYSLRLRQLAAELGQELRREEDPRALGQGAVFDTYLFSNEKSRYFYDRYMAGVPVHAGWVNETDFEPTELSTP